MVRPNSEMQEIISHWLSSGAARVVLKSENDCTGIDRILCIKPDKNDFIFLTKGSIDIRRTKDNLVICTAFSPFILGNRLELTSESYFFGEIRDGSAVYRINHEKALEIIDKNNLYRQMWLMEKYKAEALWKRDYILYGCSSREMISELISLLVTYPENFRRSISLYKFIQERTVLSTSTIARVITDFKDAGYLELKNGIIIDWRA
ncbi:TPA: helix-turn-helix domain-containing protein [Citrobacter braakii]